MKVSYHLVVVILTSALLFGGCDKKSSSDKAKEPVENSNLIVGEWELRDLTGGMVPNQKPGYPPGNGDKYKFVDLHYYERYIDGKVVASGSYSLAKDTCPATGRYMNAFVLEQNAPWKIYFEFSNDTLVLYNGIIAADGTISRYVKVKN